MEQAVVIGVPSSTLDKCGKCANPGISKSFMPPFSISSAVIRWILIYLVHITTGTHVTQICRLLLTEAHYLPAQTLQISPAERADRPAPQVGYSITAKAAAATSYKII